MVKFIFTAVSIILISCSNQTKKSDKEILEGKASYYYKNDDYQNAVMYFDSLIKLDTTVGQYYYKRAYSYSRLSLEKLAISDFEKAAGLNYKTADAYRNIALMSIGIEEDSIALVYFNKASQIDPSKTKDDGFLIESCKKNIEFRKTDAWKEFQEYKKRKNSQH